MRRQRFLFALGAALLTALASATPARPRAPVKLAIVAEITGGGAPSGTMWRDGVILGAEEINKKGGILGRQLETFVMDTQSDPPTSVAVIRRAINEQPFAIMGTVYSGSHRGQHGVRPAGGHPADQRLRVDPRRQQGQPQHLPDLLQPAGRLRQAGQVGRRRPEGREDRPDLRQRRLRQGRPGHVREVPEGPRASPWWPTSRPRSSRRTSRPSSPRCAPPAPPTS